MISRNFQNPQPEFGKIGDGDLSYGYGTFWVISKRGMFWTFSFSRKTIELLLFVNYLYHCMWSLCTLTVFFREIALILNTNFYFTEKFTAQKKC